MIELNFRTLAAAALTSSMLFAISTSAWAGDDREWRHKKWDHRHHHRHERVERVEHHYYEPPPRRVVYERQPVMMPAPIYQMPSFSQPVDPSLNFNFTIPLR